MVPRGESQPESRHGDLGPKSATPLGGRQPAPGTRAPKLACASHAMATSAPSRRRPWAVDSQRRAPGHPSWPAPVAARSCPAAMSEVSICAATPEPGRPGSGKADRRRTKLPGGDVGGEYLCRDAGTRTAGIWKGRPAPHPPGAPGQPGLWCRAVVAGSAGGRCIRGVSTESARGPRAAWFVVPGGRRRVGWWTLYPGGIHGIRSRMIDHHAVPSPARGNQRLDSDPALVAGRQHQPHD